MINIKLSGRSKKLPKSRPAARAAGLTRYFNGVPCVNGHVSARSVFNAGCLTCHGIRRDKWRKQLHIKRRQAKHARTRRQENPGKHKMWAKRSRDRNKPNKLRLNQIRRGRKRSASGSFVVDDIDRLFLKQGGRCASPYCRIKLDKFHIDHKRPLARGGSNWPRNLQLLCAKCNGQKGVMLNSEWLARYSKLTK